MESGIQHEAFRNYQVEKSISDGYIVAGIDHPFDSVKVVYPDERTAYFKKETGSSIS